MTQAPQLYLASSSPRRRQLLEQIGVVFEVVPLDLDEAPLAGELPEAYVARVALDKARAGLAAANGRTPLPVLGADTAIVLDGQLMGKPAGREQALAMLARLSGRVHEVLSAVAVADPGREAVRVQTSRVSLRPTTAAERAAYWATGEPADKAGGYAIQGLGALFVQRLEGSYSAVMGLPLYETAQLLGQFGVAVMDGVTPRYD